LSGRAKLSDFGLVSDQLVAGYGSYNGYYFHMAPEVLSNRTTSTKTDVWAMGLTIYRLLNGEMWWKEYLHRKGIDPNDSATIKDDILRGNLAGRLLWMPHVPNAWRRVVRAALRDDSATRYQDATQMLGATSGLPSSPSWRCCGDPTTLRWARDDKRRVVVEWTGRHTRSHRVRKWSEPLPGKKGRQRTFGDATTTRFEEARRQAEVFLGTRTT
jgi:serine/threonine protein kinase